MDYQEFHTRYQNFYKAQPSSFLEENNKELRINNQEQTRKKLRSTVLFERRNITVMEPVDEPSAPSKKSNKQSTMARYKEWKIQKEKKLKEERSKKKPIFKSCIAANVGFPEIKKNPIYKRVTRSQKPVASPPLPLPGRKTQKAPLPKNKQETSKKWQFHTPHLKAKNFKFTDLNKDKEGRNKLVRQFAIDEPIMGLKTKPKRRQSKRISSRKSSSKRSSSSEEEHTDRITTSTERLSASTSGMSTVYSISDNVAESSSDEVFEAPTANLTTTPPNSHKPVAYVSPFVTTSRGKGSVKKENLERSIRGLPSFTEHSTSDEAVNMQVQATGAAYFHTVLDNEISRLTSICQLWNGYKEADDIPIDARDMIDVAVGQANLLMNKKFQQFRGLINSCQAGVTVNPVTCVDLQGFWDMVFMQVTNINIRFSRLQNMKENNWEEIKPEVIKVKPVKKRELRPRNKTVSTSNIRAAILAARKKTLETKSLSSMDTADPNDESVFNGGFFIVRSPHKSTPKTKSAKKDRRSLLVSVLSTEANRKNNHQNLTPGVSMMRASRIAKTNEKAAALPVDEYKLPTPGRSILKKSKETNSHLNLSKAVLFKNDNNSDCENDQDAYNIPDLISFDSPVPKENTPRRSKRKILKE